MRDTACAAGCTQPGNHLPGCGDTACGCCCHNGTTTFQPPCDTLNHSGGDGCGPHPTDPACRGCLPRPATDGLLCDSSRRRLTTAVILATDLVIHLRASITPTAIHDGSRTKRAEAPLPFIDSAVDAADLIHSLFVAAVRHAADALGLVGPNPAPAWTTTASHDQAVGLRAGSTGVETAPYATWLYAHLDAITEHPWVADLVSDYDMAPGCVSLATAVHRANRAWPLTPPETPRARIGCPYCHARGIVAHTSTSTGMPVVLACANCGETFTVGQLRRTA